MIKIKTKEIIISQPRVKPDRYKPAKNDKRIAIPPEFGVVFLWIVLWFVYAFKPILSLYFISNEVILKDTTKVKSKTIYIINIYPFFKICFRALESANLSLSKILAFFVMFFLTSASNNFLASKKNCSSSGFILI